MSLPDEVRNGRLEGLRALRDVLAHEIEHPHGDKSQTAALARQLRDVLRDIELLEKDLPKGSVVDDLARRRKNRRAAGAVESGREGGEQRSGGS